MATAYINRFYFA